MQENAPNRNEDETEPADDPSGEPASRPQWRVFTEEAKQRQVSHWDLDYLPREEVDDAFGDGGDPADRQD